MKAVLTRQETLALWLLLAWPEGGPGVDPQGHARQHPVKGCPVFHGARDRTTLVFGITVSRRRIKLPFEF